MMPESELPADLAADLELARPVMDAALDAAAAGLASGVLGVIRSPNEVTYFGRSLRGWVSQLTVADAGRGKSGFGIGNGQLKFWSRYAIGVGALTSFVIIAFIGIKYLPAPQTPQAKTYSTAAGQRANVTLPDGSSAILAPGTTLRANGRELHLQGQAAFTVTQNSERPFIVNTGNAKVRVLGTTFNVRSYTTDNETRVTVALGKVVVADKVLSAGDRIQITNGLARLTHGVDISSELGWTSGKLVLDEAHFRDAVPDLERWYGVKVRGADVLLNRSVRAELQTKSTQEAMDILAFTLRARIERVGNTINFIPIKN